MISTVYKQPEHTEVRLGSYCALAVRLLASTNVVSPPNDAFVVAEVVTLYPLGDPKAPFLSKIFFPDSPLF